MQATYKHHLAQTLLNRYRHSMDENANNAAEQEIERRVQEMHTALKQEFAQSEDEKRTSRMSALKDIVDLKTDALESLRHTVRHSDNESLRAKVSMWAYDRILEVEKTDKDTFNELMSGMPAHTHVPSN